MYVKTEKYTYSPLSERQYYKKPFRHTKIDEQGRPYVDTYLRDVWDNDLRQDQPSSLESVPAIPPKNR